MKIVAIVQARMGSSRLPEKVLKTIINKPMIEILLTRLSQSRELNEIVVATSEYPQNDELQSIVEFLDYRCTRGSEKNVLNRFYEEAKTTNPDIVVRITGDCPLVDPSLVDRCIQSYKDLKVDYFLNTNPASYPDGIGIEVISFASIERVNNEAILDYDREHVTPYVLNSESFLKSSMQHSEDLSSLRRTVDEHEDLAVVSKVFEHFSPNIHFNWKQVLELQKQSPKFFLTNQHIKNNEGGNYGNRAKTL